MFSKCDAVLLLHTEQDEGVSLNYLTGYEGDYAYGVFFKNKRKKPRVFISSLESLPKSKDIVFEHITRRGQVKEVIQKNNIKTLGLCFSEVSKSTYDTLKKTFRGIKFLDVSEEIAKQRMKKTADEVKKLKYAIRLTEKLIDEVKEQLAVCTYEKEVESYLRKRMIELDVEPSFDPIIATGWHSKQPHYKAKKGSKILKGFCIIDMGVKYQGYCADLSRTVYIGNPTAQEKKQYDSVLTQLKNIEKTVGPGTTTIETFPMIHALGHGIGRVVHERPYLGHEQLEEGMCLAIEPAQYFSKGGIRIEDNYLVTAKGLQRLSKSSRKLAVIRRK